MNKKTIYALGFFDGVHLGHQALLKACKHLAQRSGCEVGAVTFASHPEELVAGTHPKLINTVEERQWLLLGYGATELLLLPFDEALRNMPWQDFLERLIQKGAAGFVCGDDFRFGFRGEGTAEKLGAFCRERALHWAVVSTQNLEGVRISSTHIRTLLEAGKVEEANRFLGHPHMLMGQVVSGRKLGRTLGIPTANLLIPEEVVVPRFGVYACKAIIDGAEYLAVTNVGNRPTVGGHRVTVEPWILDFDGDLYGRTINLNFHSFLRPEKKYDSLADLKAEIQKNALQTREFFEKT